MATIISTETVRAGSQRVTWQWKDGNGLVHGPNVSHIPEDADAQSWADAAEQADIAAIAASVIAQAAQEVTDFVRFVEEHLANDKIKDLFGLDAKQISDAQARLADMKVAAEAVDAEVGQ